MYYLILHIINIPAPPLSRLPSCAPVNYPFTTSKNFGTRIRNELVEYALRNLFVEAAKAMRRRRYKRYSSRHYHVFDPSPDYGRLSLN